MSRKSDLPPEVRRFIVERLACWESSKTVAEAVMAEFGLTVTRQAVERYDPSKVAGQNLAAALREYFYKVREKFRTDLDDIPIASKAVRLRRLDQTWHILNEAKAYREATEVLEQAAKEMGGMYVGRSGAIPDAKPSEPLRPRHPGAARMAEIAERYKLKVIEGEDTGKPN